MANQLNPAAGAIYEPWSVLNQHNHLFYSFEEASTIMDATEHKDTRHLPNQADTVAINNTVGQIQRPQYELIANNSPIRVRLRPPQPAPPPQPNPFNNGGGGAGGGPPGGGGGGGPPGGGGGGGPQGGGGGPPGGNDGGPAGGNNGAGGGQPGAGNNDGDGGGGGNGSGRRGRGGSGNRGGRNNMELENAVGDDEGGEEKRIAAQRGEVQINEVVPTMKSPSLNVYTQFLKNNKAYRNSPSVPKSRKDQAEFEEINFNTFEFLQRMMEATKLKSDSGKSSLTSTGKKDEELVKLLNYV